MHKPSSEKVIIPDGVETILGIISYVLDKNQPQEELEREIIPTFESLLPNGITLDYLSQNDISDEVFETIFGNVLKWALENYL